MRIDINHPFSIPFPWLAVARFFVSILHSLACLPTLFDLMLKRLTGLVHYWNDHRQALVMEESGKREVLPSSYFPTSQLPNFSSLRHLRLHPRRIIRHLSSSRPAFVSFFGDGGHGPTCYLRLVHLSIFPSSSKVSKQATLAC
jgi:hypothetical protein